MTNDAGSGTESEVIEAPDDDGNRAFTGEVGVRRRLDHVRKGRWFDDDYDRNDPSGSIYGRRNYGETCYYSGTATASPGEYRPEGVARPTPEAPPVVGTMTTPAAK